MSFCDTASYKTKSEVLNRKMPGIVGNNQYRGKTVVALDGGYSALKGVSPERTFIFPSYAKKIDKELEMVGTVKSFDIQYRNNKTGEIWLVGQSAMSLMDKEDLDSTTDASIYTRYRYDSDIFKVIMYTGLAIGCIGAGDNEIFLQTGLPATYAENDQTKLKKALAGDYDISIKLGAKPWLHFEFSLPEDHIFVMEQPQGTLCGCAYGAEGVTKQGIDILESNAIILDIGFGTEDIFSIRSGYKNGHQTYSDTGMRSVFEETLKELKKSYPVETKVFELQNFLEEGKLPVFDPDTFQMQQIEFGNILERKNRELCEKSVRRLMQDYDNLLNYKYLIVTGGTGECRFEQIKDRFKGIPTLTVLPGNLSYPDLNFCYSNVLGYYAFRRVKIKKETEQRENFAKQLQG